MTFACPDLAIASIAIAGNRTLAPTDDFFEHVRQLCDFARRHVLFEENLEEKIPLLIEGDRPSSGG